MTSRGPWRVVSASELRSGSGTMGPPTDRNKRWWLLTLDCGHRAERPARYTPLGQGHQRHRSRDDVMPAPSRVRCELCVRWLPSVSMADTTTTRRPTRRTDDDHPDTTGRTPSMSTTDKPNGDTGGSKNDPPATAQEPAPATSYAGSGTVEPIELSPETHGRHFRGSTGDV